MGSSEFVPVTGINFFYPLHQFSSNKPFAGLLWVLRVFEIVVYQINVLLFDEYRAQKKGVAFKIRGFRRMILNLFNNFGEIIFWFAASYAIFTGALSNTEMTIGRLLFNSFCVMTTFGMPNLVILTEAGLYILWFQCIAGLLMTLLSISKFIGMMPNVASLDEFENEH